MVVAAPDRADRLNPGARHLFECDPLAFSKRQLAGSEFFGYRSRLQHGDWLVRDSRIVVRPPGRSLSIPRHVRTTLRRRYTRPPWCDQNRGGPMEVAEYGPPSGSSVADIGAGGG